MQFDAQTLYFTSVAVLFIAAATAFLYWLQHRDQVAMLQWAMATATGGAGALILGIVRPIPPMWPGVVGHTLVAAGFLLAWESMRRFNGRPAATWPQGRRLGNDRVPGLVRGLLSLVRAFRHFR